MSKYVVEDGVPIPKSVRKGRALAPDSFCGILRSMEVGQSVFRAGTLSTTRQMAYMILGKGGFACRTVEGGVRVWRLK